MDVGGEKVNREGWKEDYVRREGRLDQVREVE